MHDEIVIKKKTFVVISTILLGIVVVVGIGYSLHIHFRSPVVFLPAAQNVVNNVRERPAQDPDSNISLNPLQEISGGTAAPAVSHDEALNLYRGQVMQFDGNCHVYPVIMTLPPKTVVMLDNHSKWQRNLIIGPRNYTIAPYDYVLASFNNIGQYGITCDSVQDVGIISIQ